MDRRRMDELRQEIGVQVSLIGRLVKCQLKWAGHLVRLEEEKIAKRVDRLREQGRRKKRETMVEMGRLCKERYQ